MFDIIGDIHGHFDALQALLEILGYRERHGAWRFPGGRRRVVFLGDYIDRGPKIPETVDLVRAMVEAESAFAIMGNHEYNALAWHTAGPDGRPLREHTEGRRLQHEQTLLQYRIDDDSGTARTCFAAVLAWIAQLPVTVENCSLRAVHAVWDEAIIRALPGDRPLVNEGYLRASAERSTREYAAMERLLKGVEIPLPQSAGYVDKDGTTRRETRVRWWLDYAELAGPYDGAVPLSAVAMPPVDTELGDLTIPTESLRLLPGYTRDRPVFFGHYWLTGRPRPFTPQVACLDYSVARDGLLCAYRFDGERELSARGFVCVTPEGRPIDPDR